MIYSDTNPHPAAWAKMRFIGNPNSVRKKSLKGKTALAHRARNNPDFVMVQFDDVSTGLGYGWHRFPASQFVIVTPFNDASYNT